MLARAIRNKIFSATRQCRFSDTTKVLTELDMEKELFVIKRRIGRFHSVGNYQSALESATELQLRVGDLMGKNNAMYVNQRAVYYLTLKSHISKYRHVLHSLSLGMRVL